MTLIGALLVIKQHDVFARAHPGLMPHAPDTGWLNATFSPEFRLLAACCQANFANGRPVAQRFSGDSIDWSRFLALCRRHRVDALAWHGLRLLQLTPPAPIDDALSAAAREVAQHGLRASLLSERIHHSFLCADIPLLFLKGLAVGKLAYGDPYRKRAWDLDVLVPSDRVMEAAALLRRVGLRPILPAGKDSTVQRWHRVSKESVWASADDRLHVELHNRLTENSALLRDIDTDSPHIAVELRPGVSIPTLARDEQFAYLCVHGASSAWFRLKWLADLTGVISGASQAELAQLVASAERLGAGRSAAQAVLLASWIFPVLDYDSPLATKLRASRATKWLTGRALAQLQAAEPSLRRLGTLTIHLSQLLLTPSLSDGAHEAARQVRELWHRRTFRVDP